MSDQDSSMFNEPAPQEPATQVTPDPVVKTPQPNAPSGVNVNEVFADALSSITNEKGEQKYSDVSTALSALKHTQDHVMNLETENQQFRTEQIKAATMDDVLQTMTANKDQNAQTHVPSGLDADSVKGVTLDTLREYEAQKAATANQEKVVVQLQQKFGSKEKAEEMYNSKANELGLNVAMLNQLAATSPQAVLSYFDVKSQVTPVKHNQGSVNTDALQAHQPAPAPRKNIMYGASTQEILGAWNAAGQTAQKEMETN